MHGDGFRHVAVRLDQGPGALRGAAQCGGCGAGRGTYSSCGPHGKAGFFREFREMPHGS